MGLLTTYSKANRVLDSESVTGYSKSRISGSWTYASGIGFVTISDAWEYRRFKSKTYRYVGMTYDAAKNCAEAATAYYNRTIRTSKWNADGANAGTFTHPSGGKVLMADIQIVHTGGCMYEVQISVNEDDVLIELLGTAEAKNEFAAEDNVRKYDTGDTAFAS